MILVSYFNTRSIILQYKEEAVVSKAAGAYAYSRTRAAHDVRQEVIGTFVSATWSYLVSQDEDQY